MITVKQILEHYSPVTNASDITGTHLQALVRAGLLDESKIPMLKRAIVKETTKMTVAEKKALQEVVESLATCVIEEQQDYLSKLDPSRPMAYPSEKEIPPVLVLKRKAVRVYPDNQKVALYYCQAIDKYISIPYGKNSKAAGMSLNESALSHLTVAATRGATPQRLGQMAARVGANVEDAVTAAKEAGLLKPESSNPFTRGYSRGAEHAIRTSHAETETLRKPKTPEPEMQGPIKSQFGRAPIKEAFRRKLAQKRQEQLDEVSWDDIKSGAKSAAEFAGDVTGASDLYSAGKKVMSGDYSGAAWDAAKGGLKAATTIVPGGLAVKGAYTGGKAALAAAKLAGKGTGSKVAQTAAGAGMGAIKGVGKYVGGVARLAGKGASLASAALSGSSDSKSSESVFKPTQGGYGFTPGTSSTAQTAVGGPGQRSTVSGQEIAANRKLFGVSESNNLDVLKMIVENNITHKNIQFGDTSVRVNNRIAKKVLTIYESLNKKNKKKIEKMLNEDAGSFKKVINFAVNNKA